MQAIRKLNLSILGYLVLAGICATVAMVGYTNFFAPSTSPFASSTTADPGE